jgi:uncharacterized protein YjdB
VGLNKSTLTLTAGASETLTATVAPAAATNKSVSWSSNNTAVATVSSGTVSAVTAGTATITVTTQDGSKTDSCTVTVIAAQGIVLSFADQGAGLITEPSFTVIKGGGPAEQQLINVSGAWTTVKWYIDGIDWGTGNSLTVNALDHSVGGHSLTVTVSNGSVPWSKKIPFTVTAAVTGVSLNKTALTLPRGGSETLIATVAPANAVNKTVNWSTSNNAVATVTNGTVNAVTVGTATITATTQDGNLTATCTVTVTAAQGIVLSFTDQGAGAIADPPFTVVKGGSPASQLVSVSGAWATVQWYIDGIAWGTGNSLTVNAADHSVGGHSLSVTVTKGDSIPWSKKINFTVTN